MPALKPAAPFIFVLSWNRPIYLWVCLDSLYRHTRHDCNIVLADNHSTDPLVDRVITGFERRDLFYRVHRCADNDPLRFPKLIEEYSDRIAEYFVLVEADIEILPVEPCWLTKFVGYMQADPVLGAVGSCVYQPDFVAMATARRLMPDLPEPDLRSLIKMHAPMRHHQPTDEILIEPHNPPLRLLMLRRAVYDQVGFGRDTEIHERILALGYRSKISTEVFHRHLSLLNIFDYHDFSTADRDGFFDQQLRDT